MKRTLDELVTLAQAAGEPTRLRILAVLRHGEFSVTELTEILGQSQPRVSRHLKLLGDRGLLERFREQHWIYYRVPAEGSGTEFVRDLLSTLSDDDPVLSADRARVDLVLEARRGAATAQRELPDRQVVESELADALAAELGSERLASLLYVGQSPAEQLVRLGPLARRVTGIHSSRAELQRARAVLHAQGLSHCVLQQAETTSLPPARGTCDVSIVDRALSSTALPVRVLRAAAAALASGGRLVVVEDFDALAARSDDGNPLQELRSWIAETGLTCRRLRPVDAGHSHLLIAVAASEPSQQAAA